MEEGREGGKERRKGRREEGRKEEGRKEGRKGRTLLCSACKYL